MKECKSPTPICLNGLAIDLTDKLEAETWASDFDNHSSDNCYIVNACLAGFGAQLLVHNWISVDRGDPSVINAGDFYKCF